MASRDLNNEDELKFGFTSAWSGQAGSTDRRCPVDRHSSAGSGCGALGKRAGGCGALRAAEPAIASRRCPGVPDTRKRFLRHAVNKPSASQVPQP